MREFAGGPLFEIIHSAGTVVVTVRTYAYE
jgi:hypothetical protein